MDTTDKLKALKLRAKGYPVRITTNSGQFFWRYGRSYNRDTTLASAVENAIRHAEWVNSDKYKYHTFHLP